MKQKTVTYQLALVVMVFFWGLTFPLSKISLFSVDTMPLLTLRFLLGAATVFLVIGIRERKKKTFWKIVLNPVALRGGLIVGLVAGLGMILQVGGMAYTTAAKSAFLTGLHVILIPLFGALFFGVKIDRVSCIGLLGAVFGLLIFNEVLRWDGKLSFDFGGFNMGDLMTLGCAACFAIQLNLINRYNRRCDVLALAGWQITVSALLPGFIWLLFQPGARCELNQPEIWISLLILGPLASGLFLALQVFVQTKIPVTRAALIYSLEPVFGALLAAVISDRMGVVEQVTPPMAVGGLVMLGSIIVAQMWHAKRKRPAVKSA